MSKVITVREYARLTTGAVTPSLDEASVCAADFDWLCIMNAAVQKRGAPLLLIENRHWLRLDSFVGIVEMPSGVSLEILPKHHSAENSANASRQLLRKMIQSLLNLPTRQFGAADIELFDAPLSEWVMQEFLRALESLCQRGIRFDFQRVEEEQRHLRGQLDIAKQLRQRPGRQHYFQTRHDVFTADRAENRLLKSALGLVAARTRVSASYKLAHDLTRVLADIPVSRDYQNDFQQWGDDRLMAHYIAIRRWCGLILGEQTPIAVHGAWRGISLLFPMEKLFERYVAAALQRHLPGSYALKAQASSRFLCIHDDKPMFQLKPDMVVHHGLHAWVLDTKWKLIDASARGKNYFLDQSDFYQLFAYGQRYVTGAGSLVLIYPATGKFDAPLASFHFSDTLRLLALPFDLDKGCLVQPEPGVFDLQMPAVGGGAASAELLARV